MVPMNLVPIPRRRTTVPWPPGRFKFIFGPPSSLGSRQQRRSREGESRHEATRNRITHGDTSTVPRHSSLPNRIHWTMSNELLASRALAAPARPDVVCSRELLNRAHLLNILRPHRVRVRARRRGRDQSDGQGASLRPGPALIASLAIPTLPPTVQWCWSVHSPFGCGPLRLSRRRALMRQWCRAAAFQPQLPC